MGAYAGKESIELLVALEILQDAKRRDDEVESALQVEVRDVAVRNARPTDGQVRLAQLRAADREHGSGAIDALDETAFTRQGHEHASRTAAQLEDRTLGRRDQPFVKRNVGRELRMQIVVPGGRFPNVVSHWTHFPSPAFASTMRGLKVNTFGSSPRTRTSTQ